MKDKPDIQKVREIIPDADAFEEIGSGGFKVVYKAIVNDKTEAIKLVQIPHDENNDSVRDENMRRIIREIDILSKSGSPYLVKLGSIAPQACKIDDNEYVIYSEEYIHGPNLRQIIQSGYTPKNNELAQIAICLLKAIQELSGLNVIHRDIKPDNIIRSDDPDRPFILLDLGVAFQIGGTPLTRDSGRIPGTLYYLAPEMLDQGFRQNIDYRADLYTIALSLYEFASGKNPFAQASDPPYTTLYRIKTQKPEPLKVLREDLPDSFCKLIDQLMRKVPALRPANFDKLINQMEAFL